MVNCIRKNLPYFFIVFFSFANGIVRFIVLTRWTWQDHLGSFLLQVVTMMLIWHVVKALNNYFELKLPFGKGVLKRMVVQTASSIILTCPALFIVNTISRKYFPYLEFMGKEFIALIIVMFVVVLLLVNFSFYAQYFFKQWRLSIEEKARLQVVAADAQKEKSLVQYQRLKNQVNPHFLFNTLTSLDGLILSDPELASQFVKHLSKVYRYVLEQPENEVVTVQKEIDFIQHYISTLNIKYNQALNIQLEISAAARERGIAMVSLQMLIDNAIKHNAINSSTPLHILINEDRDYIAIKNNKQVRKQIETSTRQGLKHLQHLYSFLTTTPVVINDSELFFEVKLPLL